MRTGKLALSIAFVSMLMTSSATFAQTKQPKGSARPSDAAMLKQDMRRLWTDHVMWTRDYIVAAIEKQPDASAALNRLMKNQEDIGSAVAEFYGDAAGRQLTTLLKDHIAIAGDIVKAAMAGDKTGQNAADDRWRQNATQIADFLSKANPNWPQATLLDMMNTHLATTSTELAARLSKDWEGDVKAYDAVYDHILHMADALSEGIVKQFPQKFGNAAVSTTGR
jgi:hypothetical protein